MKNILKAIPYLLVMALLLINLQTLNRIKQLEHNLRNYNQQVTGFTSQIHGIRSMIREDLEEDDLLDRFDYTVTDLTYDTATANVEIDLNQFEKDASVYLSYKEVERSVYYDDVTINVDKKPSEEVKRIELQSNAEATFMGTFNVNKYLAYELKLIVENKETIQSVNLTTIELFEKFYPDVDISLDPGTFHSSGRIEASYDLAIFNPKDLKVISALCNLKYKNKIYDSFDLLKEGKPESFGEEPLTSYYVRRDITVDMDQGAEPDFNEVIMEMIVTTDAGITYSKVWSQEYY